MAQQRRGACIPQQFAAVVKPVAFCVLFAIAAFHDLGIDQMDGKKVLRKFFLDQANPTNTPMKGSTQLLPNNEGTITEAEREKYQGMTRSLMFSMVETRPDIAFAISVASQYAKNPSHLRIEAVKTILKYLKGSQDQGILYGGTLDIEGHSNSD